MPAILSTFIKLPFVIKISVLSIFEWPLKTCFTVCFFNLLQALLVEPHKDYNLHWPMRRGRLNVHNGPCGTLTSVLSDLELIWGTAIQTMLDIPIKDLKVISYSDDYDQT